MNDERIEMKQKKYKPRTHANAITVHLIYVLKNFIATPRQDLKKLKKLKNLTTVLRLEAVLRSDPKPTCFFVRFLKSAKLSFL